MRWHSFVLSKASYDATKKCATSTRKERETFMNQGETSQVEIREMREQIMVLKQLVRDYDNYLHDQFPHPYTYWSKPAQLRQRAREEQIDIKEPLL